MSQVLGGIPFEAYRGDDPYVFACYSHLDAEIVFNDLKHLHDRGFRIWYDEGISPGEEWPAEIATAVKRSAVFVYFVSGSSTESRNCRNEVYFASKYKKRLLKIHIEPTELPEDLDFQVGLSQAVMRYAVSLERYYEKAETFLDRFGVREIAAAADQDRPDKINHGLQQTSTNIQPTKVKTFTARWFAGAGVVGILLLLIWIGPLKRTLPGRGSPTVNSPTNENRGRDTGSSTFPLGSLPPVNFDPTINGSRNTTTNLAYPLGEPDRPARSGATPEAKAKSLSYILDWLKVEHSPRYLPIGSRTEANVYAFDYCYLAGVYLPRVWWSPNAVEKLKQGEYVSPVYGQTVMELTSNGLHDWLSNFGSALGWKRASSLNDLQIAANAGKISLVSARKRDVNSGPGHISIVVPETNSHFAVRSPEGVVIQPLQSWAGGKNFRYATGLWWEDGFNPPELWIHD